MRRLDVRAILGTFISIIVYIFNKQYSKLVSLFCITIVNNFLIRLCSTKCMQKEEIDQIWNRQIDFSRFGTRTDCPRNHRIPNDSIKECHLCRRNKITVSFFLSLFLVSFCRNGLPVYEELKNLAEVKRFGMATMFFSDKDKKGKSNHKTLK